MKTSKTKRLISLLLCVLMLTGMLPLNALAADGEEGGDEPIVAEAYVGEASIAEEEPTGSTEGDGEAWNEPAEESPVTTEAEAEGNEEDVPDAEPFTDVEEEAPMLLTAGNEETPAPEPAGRVRVSIVNNTYAMSDGAAWDGTLLDEWVEIDTSSTMMSAIVSALTAKGYTQSGADSGYISAINGLAAFDGSEMSGWMGTLNDWFTSEGFDAFTVKNGKLEDKDEIAVMFTLDMGEDLGGSWGNSDTTVKAVAFSAGTLSPAFSKDVTEYTLTVPYGTTGVVVTPTASNKNYQVRTFDGSVTNYATGAYYKRSETVAVSDGSTIKVVCADPAWPSMNSSTAAVVYTFTVDVAEEPTEPDPEITPVEIAVKVNFSNGGAFLKDKNGADMVMRTVTLNTKEAYTLADVIGEAHALYHTDGTAAYGVEVSSYGSMINKFWGVEGYNFSYQINAGTTYVGSADTAVKNGDVIDVYLLESEWPDDEAYTAFTSYTAAATDAEAFTVTLQQAGYDENWNVVMSPCAGATITVDGAATSAVTDANGQAAVELTAGSHVISAVKTKTVGDATVTAISAPVCVVEVEHAEPIFDPASLMYSDFRLYPSVAAYEADPNSYYPLTPAYDPTAEDQLHYTVTLPDFQTSVFGYRTLDGMEGYLNAQQVTYQGYTFDVWSSSSNGGGAWTGGLTGVQKNGFMSKPNNFEDSRMYLDDFLSMNIDNNQVRFANVRVLGIHTASLKTLAIDGVWDVAFDKAAANSSVFVDPDSNGIDIKATGYKTNYTITIGETTANSGTAIHVAYVWDENGEMVLPITVTPPETVDGYPAIPFTYTVTLKRMPKEDKPAILTQPVGGKCILSAKGKTNITMSVGASANGTLSYQWFKAENAEGANAVAVDGATTASYKFSLTTAGDAYFFCRVTNTASAQSTDSAAAFVKVYPNPTPEVYFAKEVPALTVTEYNGTALPESYGYFYYVGDQASPIEVEYNCPVPEATVQIFCDEGTVEMLGNGKATVTPKTDFAMAKSGGTNGIYMFIYAVATLEGKDYQGYTDEDIWLYVAAKDTDVPAPVLKTQPVGAELDQNVKRTISVAADTATTVGVKYQWYVNTENSYEGATPVPSAGTNTSYTVPTADIGTRYYFCKVTNNLQGFTKSTNSDIAQIKVRGEVPIPFTGAGTEAEPYTVSTVDELKELKRLVNVEGVNFAGKFVKLTADLTLTNESWTSSIGCTIDGTHDVKNGTNLHAFSGTFDGDNHTLTFDGTGTVKPLFGYVKNTTIKNLNIQGTENVVFEDHGLISTVEGVGLSGTAAIIDHVTLKSGTKTTKSGLVGGTVTTNSFAAASATFKTTITNCVVEEGCIIGVNGDQNMIGGIAGRLICEIDNCEVSATVKGKNFVGGILGTIDNALGVGDVSNSAFHGEVISTGRNAGGIVGGGYENETAPNGFRSNLVDNTVDGTVTGVTNVGGIFGGDEYVAQSWNNSTSRITGNTFTGTVSGTTNVGAIIGFYDSLNKFNEVSGNQYAADCGADKGIGAVRYIDTNYADPTPAAGTTYFSTEFSTEDCPVVGGCAWRVAHNRTDDPLGADADQLCAVIVPAVPVAVTFNVAPSTVSVSFFKGANAETAVDASAVDDKGIVKVGSYNFHQYVLNVVPGEYSYRGTDGSNVLGGEPFTVTEAATVNLLRANIYYNSTVLNTEGDYTIVLKNGSNDVALGTPYLNANKLYTPTLLIAGVKHEGTVTLAEKWLNDYYTNNNGTFTTTPSKTTGNASNVTLSAIQQYKVITVTAPTQASTVFYKQDANYVVEEVTPDSSTVDEEKGTTTFVFKGTAAHSNYQFRSMMEGKVTQAGYLADGNSVTVTFPTDRQPSGTGSTMAYDDRGVMLNVPNKDGSLTGKNKLSLGVGETFKLRAFRAPWEIINTTSGNQMIEPDFHYAILSGDGVISIAPTTECSNSKFPNAGNGNATDNWMNVTALNPGTAIVAVWYDAIDVFNANPPAASAFSTFGATDPARYGIFVVTVGGDSELQWNPVSHDGDWDAELDTVYYVGESGQFTFKPASAVSSVTVQNVYGTALGGSVNVLANDDGSYTVPVTTGANVICADGDYMVVRARQISYTVTNNTTKETATNAAPAIKTGDSVTIAFSKLDMPVPKMSGIYNPGYLGTAKTAYSLNDTALLTSKGTQYDFSLNNSITFVAHFAGENSLKGYISLSSMGDPFGNHRNINDDGKPVNTNAGEVFGDFGVLPDITFNVEDSGEPASYEEATKISAISVVAGLNTYNMAFNWNKLQDTEAAWNKTAAQVANFALIAKVTAPEYNNVITFRYWYEGEEVHSVRLNSGISTTIPNTEFPLNPAKLLHLQVEIKPLDETLGAAKVYNYLAFPGSGSRTYVHPFIKSLSAVVNGLPVALPINTVDTAYTLDVGSAKSISLNGVQLVQIYNTATTADCSDRITITRLCNGRPVGDPVVALEQGLPNNPNRTWTLADLDITGANELRVSVTSYVDGTERVYTIALNKAPELIVTGEKQVASGKKITLAADVLPAIPGAVPEFVWALAEGDEAYASVANGVLTAKKITEAHTVNVLVSEKNGLVESVAFPVTITPVAATGVKLFFHSENVSGKTVFCEVNNGSVTVSAEVAPDNASQSVIWTCSDTKGAYGVLKDNFDGTATFTANGKTGSVTLTATAGDGSGKSAKVTVKIGKLASAIEVADVPDDGLMKLRGGASVTLKTNLDGDKTLTNRDVVWTLDDDSIPYATLSKNKLTTRKVFEQVIIHVTGTVKARPELTQTISIRLYPAVTEAQILLDGELKTKNTLIPVQLSKGTVQLSGSTFPIDAMQNGTWKSSSTKIATVDETGKVNLLKAGTVTITFTAADGTKKSTSVKLVIGSWVSDIAFTGLNEQGELDLLSGKSATVKAVATPGNATNKKLVWSTADKNIATVSNGKVTAKTVKHAETVTITAKAADNGGAEKSFDVNVRPARDTLSLWDNGADVTGKTLTIPYVEGLTYIPEIMLYSIADGSFAPADVTWKTSSAKIATVEDGVVKFLTPGNVTVTAVCGKLSAKLTIKTVVPVESVSIAAPQSNELVSGKSVTLKATVLPTDATNKKLTWTSSNTAAATVSNGKVTAKAVKERTEVTITATAVDGSGEYAEYVLTIVPKATGITIRDNLFRVMNNRKDSISMSARPKLQLSATVFPNGAKGAQQGVKWTSSSKKIATIDEYGNVTLLKKGTVTIKATAADGSKVYASFKIVVTE